MSELEKRLLDGIGRISRQDALSRFESYEILSRVSAGLPRKSLSHTTYGVQRLRRLATSHYNVAVGRFQTLSTMIVAACQPAPIALSSS
jgi:hypothetical protein